MFAMLWRATAYAHSYWLEGHSRGASSQAA